MKFGIKPGKCEAVEFFNHHDGYPISRKNFDRHTPLRCFYPVELLEGLAMGF